jgi:hypothetical protein
MKNVWVDRFLEKIDKSVGEDACWIWTGSRDRKGYGQIRINGRTQKAHRAAWTLTHGEILNSLHCLHRCDRPECVRPDHLFLGTNAENVADKVAKGRQSRVRIFGDANGARKYPERQSRPGLANGRTRLTEADVIAIRRACATGESHRSVASRYRIKKSTVGNIHRRECWARVPETAEAA